MKPLLPLAAATLGALACAATTSSSSGTGSGTRPRTVATAAKALINASVQVTFRAALGALSDVPVEMEQVDEDQGLVESKYFDLTPHEWRVERYPARERMVRVRLTVQPDTLGRGARLAVYVLYQPQGVGTMGARTADRPVPSDHPGVEFARKLVTKIEQRATGTTGSP